MSAEGQLPYIFIYLDSVGIDSLYAQTTERIEIEFTKSSEKGRETSVGAKVGLGEIFKVLFGLGNVEANMELALARKHIEHAKLQMTIEHKLFALLQYLRRFEGEHFSTNLREAKIKCQQSNRPIFIEVKERFNLPQFYEGSDGVGAANQLKAVQFEIGNPNHPRNRNIDPRDDYDSSDTYFKYKRDVPIAEVVMTASLSKFTRISGDLMSMSGHDAIMFRHSGGRNLQLNVAGYLISVANLFYQLKPYAIWL